MLHRLAACIGLLVSSCRSAPEPRPSTAEARPPVAAARDDGTSTSTASASALPAGVCAIVDDVEIRDEDVTALATRLERDDLARGGAPLDTDARAAFQRWVLDRMVDAKLLRLEAARLGVEPESGDGEAVVAFVRTKAKRRDRDHGWIDDEHALYEAAVARGLGLLDVDEAAIAAVYEREKPRWTSAEPWIDAELESIHWQEPIGVAACDEYVAAYHHCIDHDIPTSARRPMMASLDASARAWQQSARDRGQHDALTVACGAARGAAVTATRSLCDLSKPPPRGAAGKVMARREADARRKVVMRSLPTDDSPGFDPSGPRELLSADKLPAPLAKVAKRQPVGSVSAPVEHDRAFWLVTLVNRWPAGALPLEAVRETLASEIAIARFESAHAELPERLRASHRVVVRAPPP